MQKRRFIVLSGEQQPCFVTIQAWVATVSINQDQLLWFTKKPLPQTGIFLTGTVSHTIDQVLGREHHVVIFDAFSGFNPDAFAALAGTVKAGGAFILLCPPLDRWHQFNDPFAKRLTSWPYTSADIAGRFIRYFVTQIKQHNFIECVDGSTLHTLPRLVIPTSESHPLQYNKPNKEQDAVITAIQQFVVDSTDATTALIIEADRGRGKSAALGMAASQLIQSATLRHTMHIVVIAPTLKTVAVLFAHAQQQLQSIQQTKAITIHAQQGKIILTNQDKVEIASLRFIAPDAALQTLPVADLLLIDEAAAIPSALLVAYLKHYQRLVFATTVQGYEGTGGGFRLRFQQDLHHYCTQWHSLHLQQAIRYPAYDALERFIFRSLLLEQRETYTTSPLPYTAFNLEQCVIKRLERDHLISDNALLKKVFGLLVLAHYQTRPSDLRHLLDGKNVRIYAVFWQQQVIAIGLLVQEGGFDQQLAKAIYYGKRRPQGHLAAQSLAFHAGFVDAPLLITQRIMRIVVHPAWQRRGIASHLLAKLTQRMKVQGKIDYLSVSFAATEAMLSFWRKQGFKTVHMGLKRDASSGCHSLLMIKPLSKSAEKLLIVAQQQFYRRFPVLLEDALSDVEQVLIDALLYNQAAQETLKVEQLSTLDWADIHTFAYGHRGYAFCLYALRKFVALADSLALLETLATQQRQLLQQVLLDKQPVVQVAKRLKLNGKKNTDKQLRLAIKNLWKVMDRGS